MEDRKISAELYDAIMEQSKVSMKIFELLEKENFWANLDREIDRSLERQKVNIEARTLVVFGAWSKWSCFEMGFKMDTRNMEYKHSMLNHKIDSAICSNRLYLHEGFSGFNPLAYIGGRYNMGYYDQHGRSLISIFKK